MSVLEPRPGGCAPVRHFGELRFYSFGLRAGLSNLRHNGFRLGLKKTVGKITQPINSYTRFPEYFFMERAIRQYLLDCRITPRLLDVGSPKCFGLYLANSMKVSVVMTDISPLNIDEYKLMWEALKRKAEGNALFYLQDARALKFPSDHFDVVYSMSVLEHVEGEGGDASALREMIRILKPGGLLLLSVPFGNRYVEQWRRGLAAASEYRRDNKMYFFQRIYDAPMLEKRINQSLKGMRISGRWTIWRIRQSLALSFARLGEIGGLFGFAIPCLSVCINRAIDDLLENIPCSYEQNHSRRDIYGDVVIVAVKETV